MPVTFVNDGVTLFEDDIYAGKTYAFPTAPEKYGYTFTGWKLGDTTIPVDETEYSLEYADGGYEYVATWSQIGMQVVFKKDEDVFFRMLQSKYPHSKLVKRANLLQDLENQGGIRAKILKPIFLI
jgi:uncharacterized repeat protein (TIGR02543 family)